MSSWLSGGQNSTPEQALQHLAALFKEVDKDSSGGIDEAELRVFFKMLGVSLSDPIEDTRTLFAIIDTEKRGIIGCKSFCNVFVGAIYDRAAASTQGHIDLDEIIKGELSLLLAESRLQRTHIIRAFKSASQAIQDDDKGFGKGFWGSTWKHYLFEKFYTKASGCPLTQPQLTATKSAGSNKSKVDIGVLLPPPNVRRGARRKSAFDAIGGDNRYELLKTHLSLAAKGKHGWLAQCMEENEYFVGEIIQPQVVADFCSAWLLTLHRLENDASVSPQTCAREGPARSSEHESARRAPATRRQA